jgi:hypothetical protein
MKFNEEKLLEELKKYIENTYRSHYSRTNKDIQTFELTSRIPLRGIYFAIGNVLKYGDRLGEKEGFNRKDLLKIAHYTIMALYALDKYEEEVKK